MVTSTSKLEIVSKSVKDTLRIGRHIANCLGGGDIVCLFGDLGSGKTVLTKGIASGLGFTEEEVISPSFVLVRRYEDTGLPLYHFDLFRLGSLKDILAIGYEEYLYGEGVSVIEWADRLKYLLPKEFLKIELSIKTDRRRLFAISAQGVHYKEVLRKINENIRH